MWSSTNLGGTGPGSSARLIEIGAFSEEASYGWLSLYLNAAGTHMYFSGQSNGAGALYLQAPIAWTSNTWHLVVLDYTETNTLLNIDGVRATNGSGVAYWPSPSVMSNGFFVGSDSSGSNIARGDFELLRTYDGPTDALIYSSYYSNTLAKIQAWESGGGDGLLAGDGGDFNLLDGGDGGEGFGPGSGPMLAAPAMEGTNFLATITGGEDGVWYDFFRGTNFIGNSGTNSQWTWLGQGTNSGRYALPELPEPNAFYVLGTPEDSDADGLTDAYEALVQKTGQQNPDTDRDGLSDWYELNVSHTDPFTAELAPSFLNRTIMRCPVSF